MAILFKPLEIRGITIKNRLAMAPMCMFTAQDGMANDWHFVHYGTRAVGNVGLIIQEATAVVPEGRISPNDLGLWSDTQIEPLKHITSFLKAQGCIPGIQIAHAGRKASTYAPTKGNGPIPLDKGGWNVVAPSPIPFASDYPIPHELTKDEILKVENAFVASAKRAIIAGYEIIEIHAAHGYLINEFLSPITNQRKDEYGGSLENRMRFLLEITIKIREEIPKDIPLFVRISATDYVTGGWSIEDSVILSERLKDLDVDLMDVSSGGLVPDAKIKIDYGYQLPFAREIKHKVNILVGAVGLITTPQQAESILFNGIADLVILGRQLLREPYFGLTAASKIGASIHWPKEYISVQPKH